MSSSKDWRSIREEAQAAEEVEDRIYADDNYTFGDLRSDVGDYVAMGALASSLEIDEDEERIVLHEQSLDAGLETESTRRGYANRPLKLEAGVLAGSALGLVGSAWKFLEEGEPAYLGTGALSFLAGRSALNRIGVVGKARSGDKDLEKYLDLNHAFHESYSLEIASEEEAKQHIQNALGGKALVYTEDDIEDADLEDIEADIDDMWGQN